MTVFNTMFSPSKLEEAVIETLSKWVPTYIREAERQMDLTVGNIDYPKYYGNRNSFDVLSADDLPRVVVISPGLVGIPVANGGGQYKGEWSVGVGIAIAAPTETEANMLVKIYGTAIRTIMLQKRSMGGIANNVEWLDERYDDLPVNIPSQLCKAAAVFFAVEVQDIVTKWGGPEQPDDEPYAYGTVEDVIIDIVKEEVFVGA